MHAEIVFFLTELSLKLHYNYRAHKVFYQLCTTQLKVNLLACTGPFVVVLSG